MEDLLRIEPLDGLVGVAPGPAEDLHRRAGEATVSDIESPIFVPQVILGVRF